MMREVGGVTVLVDGFRAAEMLRGEDPGAFDLLSTRSVPFRWAGEGFDLRNRGPLIEVVEGGSEAGSIRAVRYNNRPAAPFDLRFDEMDGFYEAYRAFARLLHRDELEYRFTLPPASAWCSTTSGCSTADTARPTLSVTCRAAIWTVTGSTDKSCHPPADWLPCWHQVVA